MKMEKENIPIMTLSAECRRILFWFIVMPGDKSVTALRELTGIDCGSVPTSNAHVVELCNQLSQYLTNGKRHKDIYGVAQVTYRLAVPFSKQVMREIATEAETNNWWLDYPEVCRICESSWVRAMLKSDMKFYDGQAEKIYAVMQGVRKLLLGRGEIPENDKNLEVQLALASHWLNILAPNEDLLDVPVSIRIPVGFAVRFFDLAFVRGRNISLSLAAFVDFCSTNKCDICIHEVMELVSLCVWTDQRDKAVLFLHNDCMNRAGVDFLNACRDLPNKHTLSNLACAAVALVDDERQRDFADCIAWRMLSTVAAICANAPFEEIALVAKPYDQDDNLWNIWKYAYPPARAASSDYWQMECVLSVLSDEGFSPNDNNWHHTFAYAVDKNVNFIQSINLFILYAYLRREGVKLNQDTIQPLRLAFNNGESLVAAGYATLAGVVAATTAGLVDAIQTQILVKRVNAAKGIWLIPFQMPISDWQRTLEALSQVLRKATKKVAREEDALAPITGCVVWGVSFKEMNRAHSLYLLENILLGLMLDGESRCHVIDVHEITLPKYAACRTQEDNALLCAVAYYRESRKASTMREIINGLLSVPHLARLDYRYDYYQERKVRFNDIEMKRGELPLKAERLSTGDIKLSVPSWCVGLTGNYCIRKEYDCRYVYYEFSTVQKRLLEIFNNRGVNGVIMFPADADAQFRNWLARAVDFTQVEGDAGMDVITACSHLPHVDGDPKPILRLCFSNDRLAIMPGVKPHAGAEFEPQTTKSFETIFRHDDATMVLVRNAEKEAAAFAPAAEILQRYCDAREDGSHLAKSLADSLNALLAFKELGDAVVLEWPKGEKPSIAEVDESGIDFSDFKTERNWFAVRGTFKLDTGRVMDIVEMLNHLDVRASEYMRLSESKFLRLSESLRRRLSAMKVAGVLRKDSVEISPAAVPMLAKEFDDGEGLPNELRACALRLAKELKREISVPNRLQAKLRPYQRDGFVWLARHAACGFGACLADDMGLGKTLQMIALLLDRADQGPSLVVAPASVCGNWKNEILRFAPMLRVFLAWEFDYGDQNPFSGLQAGDVIITSYGLLVSRTHGFVKHKWNGVILDEAQAIKNGVSKRAHAVKEIHANFRMVATGTPVENKLSELWSIFDFLNPGLLGPMGTFAARLTNPDGTATDSLKRLVAPFVLRRIKGDVLKDLPPKTEITLPVELGKDERTAYEACRLHALESLKGNEDNRICILAELTRIRRFCCHPSLVLPKFKESAKLDALQELLTDLKAANHRALVFSQFTDYLDIVRKLLEKNGWTYQYLDGATPIADRGRAVNAFQGGEGDFFLISLKAGGMGLNLTAANYVVLLDPWWNPAVENQAADRVHRIGQKNPVTVYRLIAANTVEERVLELHKEKLHIAEDVLEGTSKSKLTPEMLMKLFA